MNYYFKNVKNDHKERQQQRIGKPLALGPLTPLQIFLSRRKNDVLVTWMKYLMLDCSYLGSICQAIGSKFDQNLNLNFPSLFSDWSIQKFLETNSKNF